MSKYQICLKCNIYFFKQISTLHDPLKLKIGFLKPVCSFFVVCGHDNFWKNYQIDMRFSTLYQSPIRKNKFVSQPYPTEVPKIRSFLVFLETTFW